MPCRFGFVLLLLVIGLLAGAFVASVVSSREPEYGGRKLSEWLPKLSAYPRSLDQIEPGEAIRHMGPDAMPYLIKWISYEQPWKTNLMGFVDPIMLRLKLCSQTRAQREQKRQARAQSAVYALTALGPQAEAAIGELSKMLVDTNACATRRAGMAAVALASIGQIAVPPLISALTNCQSTSTLRCIVAGNLRHMGTNAWPAIPALRAALTHPYLNVRITATNLLRDIDLLGEAQAKTPQE